jgi:hypothetical protein
MLVNGSDEYNNIKMELSKYNNIRIGLNIEF